MNVKKSNNKYFSEKDGCKSKLTRAYNGICNFIKWLCLTATLLLIPACIVGVVYYFFVCYNPVRVILCCIMLWSAIYSNMKL